jgi:hypothetical protein
MDSLLDKPGTWAINGEFEVIDEELRKNKKVDSLGKLYVQVKYVPTGGTDAEPTAPAVTEPAT